jgi:two-component system phosphate regulon sensor histidine kinase PhoR
VLARATSLRGRGGVVVVMHDVTELRRLETVRRDFVANVSHELRTPVSVIRANAETLLDGGLEDAGRARGFVESLLRHAERLSGLVSDLLDIARIEAGRVNLDPKPLQLADVILRAAQTVEPNAQRKSIAVRSEVLPDLTIVADVRALEHVVLNLLDNAVKYTPAGGHVVVRARTEGRTVRVEVRDDGPGIEPRHRARIFERFYRVDPGRSRDMGGTGLGLSIVKNLTESMGGRVGVEPASPRGSIFWFTLPTDPTQDPHRFRDSDTLVT